MFLHSGLDPKTSGCFLKIHVGLSTKKNTFYLIGDYSDLFWDNILNCND